MVPPFLAYYGVLTRNESLLLEAYNQIRIYRDELADGTGMWQHVRHGSWEDKGHWSTGNGWAAMGMLRVMATIRGSEWANPMRGQVQNLETWVKDIHDAMWPYLVRLFVNNPDSMKLT